MKNNLLHLASKLHMTQGVAADANEHQWLREHIQRSCTRFLNGDWGDICDDDKKHNDHALEVTKDQIVAAYDLPEGKTIDGEEKIWIIAAAEHSYATVLYPSEY